MTKKYQKTEIDTPAGDGFVVPDRVSVAMAEIAGSMREGLLALAVGTGLQVMQALMVGFSQEFPGGQKRRMRTQRAMQDEQRGLTMVDVQTALVQVEFNRRTPDDEADNDADDDGDEEGA